MDRYLQQNTYYFVRINQHPGYADIIGALEENEMFYKIFCVSHKGKKGENPHYHLIIETSQKLQAFRKYLKSPGRFDKGKGNAHMSIKYLPTLEDVRKSIQYCFHEDSATIILSVGYTDDYISKQREEAKTFELNSRTYSKTLKDQTLKYIRESEEFHSRTDISHRSICMSVWTTCTDLGYNYPNKYLLEGIIRDIQVALAQDGTTYKTVQSVYDEWYENFFPYQ